MLQSTRQFGEEKEQRACEYLIGHGLKLLVQNYYCKFGEIDLIMQDQETLVFVEVRYRKHNDYGGGLESITHAKQRKIIRTAQHYLLKSKLQHCPCRFDVIAYTNDQKIDWIKDAFWVKY
ncbi:MAG: hypothetical protein AMJ43_00835 [Coxiella sp. DG_40]|nr:MAG: hypothetical protein AMJ43_00835 [Coxiella sp. DG_40]